jgi:hypothetical protein
MALRPNSRSRRTASISSRRAGGLAGELGGLASRIQLCTRNLAGLPPRAICGVSFSLPLAAYAKTGVEPIAHTFDDSASMPSTAIAPAMGTGSQGLES